MSEPNPLRSALLSFFNTLLSADDSSAYSIFYAAKNRFEAVASEHYDRFASRSDAVYARVISLLDIITPEELLKVCEGFRQISLTDPYNALNAARPAFRAGIRALLYGCANGIEPCAVSYRHSPHHSGRTVSRVTADRLRVRLPGLLGRPKSCHAVDKTCVVWIDRAVKGLSSDGAWFVRGLLPYAVVAIAIAHAGISDMQRPWIWLEWMLSSRSMMAEGLRGVVAPSEVVFIALQAMYMPGDMLRKYEYKDEMEAVILDMFLFGLAALSNIMKDRNNAVAGWSDYKVGLAVVLALSLSPGDTKWSLVLVDDGNPYGNNLFRCGFVNLLQCAGAEIQLTDDTRAYAFVDGQIALMKMKRNQLSIARKTKKELIARLNKVAEKGRLARYLKDELHSVSVYCDVNAELPQHDFITVDELAVLASCQVTLHEHWERRMKTDDDIRSGTLTEDLVVSVAMDLDVDKAVDSSRRKNMYNLKRWWQKTQRGSASPEWLENVNTDEADANSAVASTLRKGVVFADYNQGCVRVTTQIGDETVFRRLGRPTVGATERCSAVFACVHGHVGCATAAALNGSKWRLPRVTAGKIHDEVVVVECTKDQIYGVVHTSHDAIQEHLLRIPSSSGSDAALVSDAQAPI